MSDVKLKPSRRGFLLGAVGAGAATAAAAATAASPAIAAAAAESAKPVADTKEGGGYHLSAHVRQYYRSTTI